MKNCKKIVICLKNMSAVEVPLTIDQYNKLMNGFNFGDAKSKDNRLIVRSVDIWDQEKNVYVSSGRITYEHDKK